MDRSRAAALALVAVSFVILGVATLVVSPGWVRLLVAIVAVLPGYAAAFLLSGHFPLRRRSPPQTRRFFALRRVTEQFLEEVRRMNALRVAVDTGSRSPREARPEFEDVERTMLKLIAEMREAAGQVTPPTGFSSTTPPTPAPRSRTTRLA